MGLAGSGSDRGATRFEAAATWLAAWITVGLYYVGWALATGLADNATFSPYHVPGYLGVIALFAVVAERMFDRSATRGSGGRIRSAWAGRTTGERVIVVGTAILAFYIVADLLWVVVVGIGQNLEGRQAPTRLLLPVGLSLVASGWLVAAAGSRRGVGWLGVVGVTTIFAAIGFWIGPWHPVYSPWAEKPAIQVGDLRGEIWTMAADGGTQTRIVASGPGEATQPAWSPDGSRIVYVAWAHAGTDELVADLWTVAPDGSDARQITSDPEWDWIPAWSPDGAWIAFTSRPTPATPAAAPLGQPQAGGAPDVVAGTAGGWSIYLVRPDGTERRQLTTGGESMAPVWSPDGSRIAYHGTRDGNLDIFVANADGTSEQRVTDDPGADWSPIWSPDGTRLIFTSDRSGDDDVWVVSASGGAATNMTNDPAADQVPIWSPDGARIAFVSDRTADVEVWSMAANGTDLRNLTQSPASDDGRWSIGWSADGKRIVYGRTTGAPLASEPLVREDLGMLGVLVTALALALLVLAVDGIGGLPFGGLTVMIGVSTLLIAAISNGWRFIPAGIAAGVVGDLLTQRLRGPQRRVALAALVPATFVATQLLILALTGSLGWSPTLSLGAVLGAGLVGLSAAVATIRPSRSGVSGTE